MSSGPSKLVLTTCKAIGEVEQDIFYAQFSSAMEVLCIYRYIFLFFNTIQNTLPIYISNIFTCFLFFFFFFPDLEIQSCTVHAVLSNKPILNRTEIVLWSTSSLYLFILYITLLKRRKQNKTKLIVEISINLVGYL